MNRMEILVLLAVFMFTVSATPTKYGCTLEHVKQCPMYDSIAVPRFYPFIAKSGSEDSCLYIRTALRCTAEIQQNCSRFDTLLFDTQKDVIDMICYSRKQDYIQSEPCFSKDEVKDSVLRKCMSSIPPQQNLKNPCGASEIALQKILLGSLFSKNNNLLQAPTCARDVVVALKGCSESDAIFLYDLVKAFLKPTLEAFTCPYQAESFISSKKPSEVQTTPLTTTGLDKGQSTHQTSTGSSVRVDLQNVLLHTDHKLSLILSALQPKAEISGLTGCRDGPIVQVNNFIFINSLSSNSTLHNVN